MRALFCLAPVILAALGCDTPPQCSARGASTPSSGSALYAGQASDGVVMPGLAGALPTSIVIYDATPDCLYDGMEFTVGVGSCLLWAQLTSSDDDAGATFSATLEPGQTCALPLASGPVTVKVSSGLLSAGAGTELTVAGYVAAPNGATGGYLQWSFVGD